MPSSVSDTLRLRAAAPHSWLSNTRRPPSYMACVKAGIKVLAQEVKVCRNECTGIGAAREARTLWLWRPGLKHGLHDQLLLNLGIPSSNSLEPLPFPDARTKQLHCALNSLWGAALPRDEIQAA